MSQIADLQQKLGVPQTDKWDTATQAALTAFQAGTLQPPTGLPTPAALSMLGVYNPLALASSKTRQFITSGGTQGSAGGGFGQSLLTSFNQVPWYVYLSLGLTSLVFAGLAIHRRNQRA